MAPMRPNGVAPAGIVNAALQYQEENEEGELEDSWLVYCPVMPIARTPQRTGSLDDAAQQQGP